MTGRIRTVSGDIDPGELGPTDYHEHLFQVSPLLPGDDLDDERASGEEAASLLGSGFAAMVDATPLGLGRRPVALARIARATGLRVVMTTGVHRREHYAADSPLLAADAATLTAAFVRDLEHGAREGLDPEPDREAPRAGLLKAGLGYWRIDAAASRCLEAVGVAHAATGAPVMVHLEHGSAAHEVLDLLGSHGVAADAVALAHIDRNPDAGLLGELAARGAYLGVDGPARHREWPDSVIVELVDELVQTGHGDRVLLGGDVARASRYRAYGGLPGLAYLGERFLPRVVRAVGPEAAARITTANPACWLTWR
ncbi:aryldialkylphosphatase [Herbiconiux sp. KACC 21604]|uniref:phosphotriesterase family protein n=1 Tax=unclassified Herbiconiux TaxID=2618217 RepID=UPI0014916210|nr:aryldialkylphosphatase [Herbiconiux sp. SALV-R1]QJU55737.1 aryldialkylphosphatase [Herbiconiux sp. SALV-R1]WPO86945.1 aryldialkylphosphatase [Herbiconiux sp. KACC 21604]